jgi:hypothetical protein
MEDDAGMILYGKMAQPMKQWFIVVYTFTPIAQ